MPELPEVETITRYLDKTLVGKTIHKITVFKAKSFAGNSKDILGEKINGVERRAKLILIHLSNNKTLLVHLKMSGQLLYKSRITNNELSKNKYLRVLIDFTDGSRLLFNDLRIFGWMRIISNSKIKTQLAKLGPEPFSKEFTVAYLQKIFSRTNKAVKLVLMDQEKIAGIGNIYANEILFDAKIDPFKASKKLNKEDIKILRYSILKVLQKAIKYKGSSAKDDQYVQATGKKGRYQQHFKVYQKEKAKCRQCSGVIKRQKIGGRSTFWCSQCQK